MVNKVKIKCIIVIVQTIVRKTILLVRRMERVIIIRVKTILIRRMQMNGRYKSARHIFIKFLPITLIYKHVLKM